MCLQKDVWCESDREVLCSQEDGMMQEGVREEYGVYNWMVSKNEHIIVSERVREGLYDVREYRISTVFVER